MLMKKMVIFLCAALMVFSVVTLAYAQTDPKAKLKAIKPKDYPTEPITFVIVYPAGGGMDVTARMLAKYVEKYIDNRVVVENRTGGTGLVGHTYLATQAKNDGYTVGILGGQNFWIDGMLRSQGKWSYKNTEAVAYINENANTWVVSTEGPL